MNKLAETTKDKPAADIGKSEYNELLAATGRKINLYLYLVSITWFLLVILAVFDAVHWAAWPLWLAANTGLIISLGMQLMRGGMYGD